MYTTVRKNMKNRPSLKNVVKGIENFENNSKKYNDRT
jgi:hypothetical protein